MHLASAFSVPAVVWTLGRRAGVPECVTKAGWVWSRLQEDLDSNPRWATAISNPIGSVIWMVAIHLMVKITTVTLTDLCDSCFPL